MKKPQNLISFSNLSINTRLMIIILLVSFISVLITTISVTYLSIHNLKEYMVEDIELTASLVGERNQFALTIGRRDDVIENMQVFRLNPSVKKACIYDKKGEVFAYYPLDETQNNNISLNDNILQNNNCPEVKTEKTTFYRRNLETIKMLSMRGQHIGAIYISSNLDKIEEIIENKIVAAFIIIFAAFAVAFILARIMQSSISSPIQRLTEAAKNVSKNQNYAFRVKIYDHEQENTENEMAMLLLSFNSMLKDIEKRDETLQRQYLELEKAKEEADMANLAKSRFLASISHELRTPLNAIIGFSSIITGQLFGPINPKYFEYAEDIHDSGSHLLEIINDILDLSKAEAGKLTLDIEEFDLHKALNKCFHLLENKSEAGHIKMSLDIDEDVSYIVADRMRFVQIVLNILSNALKFTQSGGKVKVRVKKKIIKNNNEKIIVMIEDSGIGMSAADVEKAMQSFGQIDSGLNRRYEGTGLGLPLAHKLMELHGGNLQITSELGSGTTVTLTFYSNPDLLGNS